MSRLTQKPPSTAVISGVEYTINDYYVNALLTWDAFEAYHYGEISNFTAAVVAVENMFKEPRPPICDESIKFVGEYLQKYSSADKKDNPAPYLCIDQDSQMIHDAILSAGVDLDVEKVSYPRFMALLREVPKDAQLCRVVYLRQQFRKGKLTKEERAECLRRGWHIIKLKDKRKVKDEADNKEYFKDLQNKMRAERGLPPI